MPLVGLLRFVLWVGVVGGSAAASGVATWRYANRASKGQEDGVASHGSRDGSPEHGAPHGGSDALAADTNAGAGTSDRGGGAAGGADKEGTPEGHSSIEAVADAGAGAGAGTGTGRVGQSIDNTAGRQRQRTHARDAPVAARPVAKLGQMSTGALGAVSGSAAGKGAAKAGLSSSNPHTTQSRRSASRGTTSVVVGGGGGGIGGGADGGDGGDGPSTPYNPPTVITRQTTPTRSISIDNLDLLTTSPRNSL